MGQAICHSPRRYIAGKGAQLMRARILIAIVVSIALCAVSFSLSEAYRSIKRKKDAG